MSQLELIVEVDEEQLTLLIEDAVQHLEDISAEAGNILQREIDGLYVPDTSTDKVDKEVGKSLISVAELIRLATVATDATKNAPDASLRDRSTHTGTQPINTVEGLIDALDSKVDKVVGYSLVDDDDIDKLSTVEQDAQKNTVNSVAGKQGDVLLDKEDVGLSSVDNTSDINKPISNPTQAALDNKVDKQAGKGLSDSNFTQSEKDKLSSLESSKFIGLFVSESALPLSGRDGDYANVDGGVGSDVYRVIWDSSDNKWVRVQGVSTELTDAQIKQQYESNPDTNAFTDDEKAKLASVAKGATANRADSGNADKLHTHTLDQVDGLGAALDNKVNTSNITQTTGQSTTEIMSQKAVTDIFLQYNDFQTGLRWNQETDVYQVLGSIHRTRIQERMRRCVLNDDGTVNYYLDQHDSTKKEDGTPAILDGTDGNVMVEIPKFYYKQHLAGDQHEWWISATPAAGYEVHEAFLKNGVTEVDYVYWAAYRPTTLDDKLMSVSDVAPTASKNISTFRAEARANGEGWNLPNYHILTAIRLLYLLEYCTFNSQAVLGNGNHIGANYTRTTGVSNILGNESSSPAITGWMSYRGIEDFYASSWQMIDGCGLNDGVFRSTNVEADYNNTLTGDSYVSGASVPEFSGTYIKKITSDFLPQLGGGSSSTFTCDGAWSTPSGLRTFRFGGSANCGVLGGVFCAYLTNSFSLVNVTLAAGLSFR